ncbi:MAG: DUF1868 domain-containing protein [Oculatellaceae cyanobacterium bins.114]|nr:DUF1868 domain-containing protein [Oculatellaceae cyanobacterium bins.114]
MDDIYQVYVNRVARMTLPEAYKSQVQHIQPSPKFQQQPDGTFQPTSFPGYSVITPPWADESENQEFYQQLQAFQQQVAQKLSPELFVALPPDSFHMTIADLIWDSAYRHADENPHFQEQLRDRVSQIFQQCQPQKAIAPIYWQVMGLVVMPRALAVSLTPKTEEGYEQIIKLRRAIYQNSALMALGIEQQYHLTAHITIGYFGSVTGDLDRDDLGQQLDHLNQQWLTSDIPQPLLIQRAELRKFDNMMHYYREPDWPVLDFSYSTNTLN